MAKYSSNPEGIAQLRSLAARLPEILDDIEKASSELYNVFGDNIGGLGEHTADIQEILDTMLQEIAASRQCIEGVAEDLEDLAETYEDLASATPYSSAGN